MKTQLPFQCVLSLALTAITVMSLSAHAQADDQAKSETVICFSDKSAFGVETPAGWLTKEEGAPRSGICFEATRKQNDVRALSQSVSILRGAVDLYKLSGLTSEDVGEIRQGDPISADGKEFKIKKLFSKTAEREDCWSFAVLEESGTSILFSLHAPDRTAHDKNYQAFRDWVRTFRSLDTPVPQGVSH